MSDQMDARLQFSRRERSRTLGAGIPALDGPYTPADLPPSQYPHYGETTLEERTFETLRRPTKAEVEQEGSPYRSDLNPHNYQIASIWLEDIPLNTAKIVEMPVNFSVWAVSILRQPAVDINAVTIQYGQTHYFLQPWDRDITFNSFANLPYGLANKVAFKCINIGGDITPGAGIWVYLHDRWIPPTLY